MCASTAGEGSLVSGAVPEPEATGVRPSWGAAADATADGMTARTTAETTTIVGMRGTVTTLVLTLTRPDETGQQAACHDGARCSHGDADEWLEGAPIFPVQRRQCPQVEIDVNR